MGTIARVPVETKGVDDRKSWAEDAWPWQSPACLTRRQGGRQGPGSRCNCSPAAPAVSLAPDDKMGRIPQSWDRLYP